MILAPPSSGSATPPGTALTIRIAQRIIITILHQRIRILYFHPVHVLPHEREWQRASIHAFKVCKDVADLRREQCGQLGQAGLRRGVSGAGHSTDPFVVLVDCVVGLGAVLGAVAVLL